MRHFTTRTVQDEILVCDRCGSETDVRALEWKQAFRFSFRAGYGSEFGDGNLVEGDFCDHCIQELFGAHFRVSDDDPFAELQRQFREQPREQKLHEMYARQITEAEHLFGLLRQALARMRQEQAAAPSRDAEGTGHA